MDHLAQVVISTTSTSMDDHPALAGDGRIPWTRLSSRDSSSLTCFSGALRSSLRRSSSHTVSEHSDAMQNVASRDSAAVQSTGAPAASRSNAIIAIVPPQQDGRSSCASTSGGAAKSRVQERLVRARNHRLSRGSGAMRLSSRLSSRGSASRISESEDHPTVRVRRG